MLAAEPKQFAWHVRKTITTTLTKGKQDKAHIPRMGTAKQVTTHP